MNDVTGHLVLSDNSRRDYDGLACSYSVLWEHVLENGLLEDLEEDGRVKELKRILAT